MANETFMECLGASKEVGRSAFLIHTDKKIYCDYGIKLFDESGSAKFPQDTETKADLAVLTHAHLDHSGCLPSLYRESKMRWYSTPPTFEICQLLWEDSMRIMGPTIPYEIAHYKKALKAWSPMLYGQRIQVGETSMRFYDAGHISGSAMLELKYKDKTTLYTGDLKCSDTHMHKGARFVSDVDNLIIESTYAFREHPEREVVEKQFMEEIEAVVDSGGTVLLPSFSLGRTQELISVIRSQNKHIPVHVDGMGKDISKVYLKYPQYIRDANEFRKHARSVTFVEGQGDRRRATREPGVIISTAGMMNGGPILNYLFNVNPKSKLIFTGYCVEGTNGWMLQHKSSIIKDGTELHVDLPVEYMDFSAHAGRTDLLNFIKHANPRKVVLVHGDSTEQFAHELRENFGYDAVAPKIGERVQL